MCTILIGQSAGNSQDATDYKSDANITDRHGHNNVTALSDVEHRRGSDDQKRLDFDSTACTYIL